MSVHIGWRMFEWRESAVRDRCCDLVGLVCPNNIRRVNFAQNTSVCGGLSGKKCSSQPDIGHIAQLLYWPTVTTDWYELSMRYTGTPAANELRLCR